MWHPLIKTYLFGPWPIVFAWAVGGCLLLFWRKGGAPTLAGNFLEDMTYRQAILIGLFQCLALWPGVSPSLATIVGGLVIGLPLSLAVEFSFLLGSVTLTAASFYEVYDNGASVLADYGIVVAGVGVISSLISAAVAIRWMLTFLKKRDMAFFGYYRIGIAMLASGYLLWL
jgi:undecaprenyl-diphosphatase